RAEYLALEQDSYLEGPVWISDLGPQLTREFRALKVWAVMQALGVERYRELWRSDIAVAREIERLARQHPRLEVLAPSDLSCFCLRYVPGRGTPTRSTARCSTAPIVTGGCSSPGPRSTASSRSGAASPTSAPPWPTHKFVSIPSSSWARGSSWSGRDDGAIASTLAVVRDRPTPGPRRGQSAGDRQQTVRRFEQLAPYLGRVLARECGVLQVRLAARRIVESRLHSGCGCGRLRRWRVAREPAPGRDQSSGRHLAREARHPRLLRPRPPRALHLAHAS